MKRYESLDWLRGLCALAIMVYHLVSWSLFHPEAGNILGNFGIYGVSIFFVLSGLSMGIVYHNYIKDLQSSLVFFIRRLFRLLPLLWIAIGIVSAVVFILHKELDLYKIFLNVTLLFGFVAPAQYINIGAWSIGNECVYYAFTPFLIMLYARSKTLGNLAVFFTIVIGMYFTFYLLDPTKTLASQWTTYINPFNNLYLYAVGLSLYYNFHDANLKKISYLLILLSMGVFATFPVTGDQILIVSGYTDLIFSLAAISLTLGFYKLEINLPKFLASPLASLGESTYGVYLLHPIVFMFINKLGLNPILSILISSLITILLAKISYEYYERRWIKIGKNVTIFNSKQIQA